MLLEAGQWLGKGSVLVEGVSLGRPVTCEVTVAREEDAITLTGRWTLADDEPGDFSVRIVGNEVGTYTLALRAGGDRLHGTAKLDSPPNAGLVWNDAGNLHAGFALFAISGGYGFRGFCRDRAEVLTWEIAFRLRQEVVRGPNVVSLHRRRPR